MCVLAYCTIYGFWTFCTNFRLWAFCLIFWLSAFCLISGLWAFCTDFRLLNSELFLGCGRLVGSKQSNPTIRYTLEFVSFNEEGCLSKGVSLSLLSHPTANKIKEVLKYSQNN
uniref:Uncharacterized protein n=1 Tax=Meloidogyne incognita TaxID=6306 RepID=A0A914LE92_MELIC